MEMYHKYQVMFPVFVALVVSVMFCPAPSRNGAAAYEATGKNAAPPETTTSAPPTPLVLDRKIQVPAALLVIAEAVAREVLLPVVPTERLQAWFWTAVVTRPASPVTRTEPPDCVNKVAVVVAGKATADFTTRIPGNATFLTDT